MSYEQDIRITQNLRFNAFSTNTPLGIAGVYTSPSIDAINYTRYGALLSSDVAGSYYLQYSDDAINWYNATASANVLGANGVLIPAAANINLRYMRIVYTNGSAAQNSFKLSLYLIP